MLFPGGGGKIWSEGGRSHFFSRYLFGVWKEIGISLFVYLFGFCKEIRREMVLWELTLVLIMSWGSLLRLIMSWGSLSACNQLLLFMASFFKVVSVAADYVLRLSIPKQFMEAASSWCGTCRWSLSSYGKLIGGQPCLTQLNPRLLCVLNYNSLD